MRKPLEIGFTTSGQRCEVANLEALPRVDSIWVGGHVTTGRPGPEVMTSLANVAALTSRVNVGSSILLLPLYHPVLLAKQVAEIDRRADGRVVLGVGVGGEFPGEFNALGIPLTERGRRTNESIDILRLLWRGMASSYSGQYFSFDDVSILPTPVQEAGPRIVVAGRSEAAMRRAAVLGDGWMPYIYSPGRYAKSVQYVKEVAEKSNRDLRGFAWYAHIFLSIEDDEDLARQVATERLTRSYGEGVSRVVDAACATGTPDKVAERIQEYVAAGVNRFILVPCRSETAAGTAARFCEEVLPATALS